ncbi:MAG: DUF2231 domain-containing protein [Bacteroidales bacterium]|nr:DUF2231 domain-containing protein [Bacteroidales bacterium]
MDTSHLHPMIVHFPIALLLTGLLFDTIGLFAKKTFYSKVGFYLLVLGALGTVVAFLTGHFAGSGITEQGALKQALETHENAAELTIWIVSITATFRILLELFKKYKGIFKAAAFVLFLASAMAIARTGYYGGELVYKHAAGVQLNLGFGLNTDSETN